MTVMSNGVDVLTDNTDVIVEGIQAAISRGLEKIGLAAEGYAQLKCPVDTGNLRGSITHIVDDSEKAVYIGTNVEYAPYVELGTRHQAAQPYLRPAAQDHASEYREILKAELGG